MNNRKIEEKGGPGFEGVLEAGGFTLVEILIAASVLLVGVLGIAALLPTASTNIFVASEETKAAILAQDLMDMLDEGEEPERTVARPLHQHRIGAPAHQGLHIAGAFMDGL